MFAGVAELYKPKADDRHQKHDVLRLTVSLQRTSQRRILLRSTDRRRIRSA